MRSWWLAIVACAVGVGCAQPLLVTCPPGETPCADGCVDMTAANDNCGLCGFTCPSGSTCTLGQCKPVQTGACATNNGGCSPQATCMDLAGQALCLCNPGFTGDGHTCGPCTGCGDDMFASTLCTPTMDAVCSMCSAGCPDEQFEQQPCMPTADRVCAACTVCGTGQFETSPCGPNDRVCTTCSQCGVGQFEIQPCGTATDTMCGQCPNGCTACTGSDLCTACAPGFQLMGSACLPTCGNGVLDAGETCDDGNAISGDGCSSTCAIETGFYCFQEPQGPSHCIAGTCVSDPLTALPLGPAFALDGVGTAGSAGLHLTQRSTIHTNAAVAYPMMVEADVTYSGQDTTFAGARGPGLRDPDNSDEPTDSMRARLGSDAVQIAAGPTTIQAQATPFTVAQGVVYHVRYIDDGSTATVEWFDTTNPQNLALIAASSSFHGGGDAAFVGGGDQGGVTVANVRACGAPALPVTSGLVARYSAMPSWTAIQDDTGAVSTWQDLSGGGNDLLVNGTSPIFRPGLLNGHGGVDFTNAGRLSTSAFALTTDVTVFAVIVQNVPAQFGAIAHHGDRDLDWSMEQSGDADRNVLHWQTNNDNTNMDLTLVQGGTYILTGRFAGLDRYFSASTFDGAPPAETSITDASHSITAGSKQLFVGTSDNAEASNAYIADLVYFDRALSDNERDQVIAYLRNLWRP